MPLIAINNDNPFVDGRQSERAMAVRTGVERYFTEASAVCLPELSLPTGRRADLVALSPKGFVTIIEIKSSIADMNADKKWPDYRDYCDEFLFATLPDVPADVFPSEPGFMIADHHGAEIIRPSPSHPLSAARRKKLHLIFARSSALRLAKCCAHAGLDSAELD